jgi:hypothetical protein
VKRALIVACVTALVTPGFASAAIFIRLQATVVHPGGVFRVVGNASAMPLYALPVARIPSCMRSGECMRLMHTAVAPRAPFVFLGRTPGRSVGFAPVRAFRLKLPPTVEPGSYKVFVWCRSCGGTLIVAGTTDAGQTLRIVA